jgi:hypothetical protein
VLNLQILGYHDRMRLVAGWILSLMISLPLQAKADNPTREFLMSCTYGVLAGTLVGAASLAFVDKPGDNLNRVARGASLGLYSGIILGFYIVYVVPSMDTPEDDGSSALGARLNAPHQFDLFPLFSPKGMDGFQANWVVTRF